MKKRGDSQSLWIFIGVVFVVIILYFFVTVIFSGLNFGSLESQQSVANYYNLVKTAKSLASSPDYVKTATLPKFMIDRHSSVVAFNRNQQYSLDSCDPQESVKKPASCGNSACLCYYSPGLYSNFNDNQLKESCVSFPDVDYFISFYYAGFDYGRGAPYVESHYGVDSTTYKNIAGDKIEPAFPLYYPYDDYSYLFIYGQCDGWAWDQSFGTHTLYLEKLKDPLAGKTYLFVAEYVNKDIIKSRLSGLQQSVDKVVKKTPEQFLALINSSLQNNKLDDAKLYAYLFKKYYGDNPDYASQTTELNKYLLLIGEEEQRIAEERQKLAEQVKQQNLPCFSGRITPPCYCGNIQHSSGYCCADSFGMPKWQASECPKT